MVEDNHTAGRIDRRDFVKAALIPTVLSVPGAFSPSEGRSSEQAPQTGRSGPDIVDSNVHLFEWPFRKLKYARTDALIAKLRKHRITQAWAGSFAAVLHKQFDAVNRELANECQDRGEGMLIPIGTVNPAWAGWEEDLRRCHEQYRMPGLRLFPTYHRYTLEHPEFQRMLQNAAARGLLIQIALRMEDERVHHPATSTPTVNVAPLVNLLKRMPQAKVQLINSAGPLLGNAVGDLVAETNVTFDISAVEGNGGVGRLIDGENPSFRGAIPVERLVFGSHAPFFPCESALMKLFESPLSLPQLKKLMYANAQRVIG